MDEHRDNFKDHLFSIFLKRDRSKSWLFLLLFCWLSAADSLMNLTELPGPKLTMPEARLCMAESWLLYIDTVLITSVYPLASVCLFLMTSVSLSLFSSSFAVSVGGCFAQEERLEDEKAKYDSETLDTSIGLTAMSTCCSVVPERSFIGFYSLLCFAGAFL